MQCVNSASGISGISSVRCVRCVSGASDVDRCSLIKVAVDEWITPGLLIIRSGPQWTLLSFIRDLCYIDFRYRPPLKRSLKPFPVSLALRSTQGREGMDSSCQSSGNWRGLFKNLSNFSRFGWIRRGGEEKTNRGREPHHLHPVVGLLSFPTTHIPRIY